jgi:hypothetical protein
MMHILIGSLFSPRFVCLGLQHDFACEHRTEAETLK